MLVSGIVDRSRVDAAVTELQEVSLGTEFVEKVYDCRLDNRHFKNLKRHTSLMSNC